jgi:hypothetical protein
LQGNYTVEQSWDEVTVKFYNRDFYENFRESLLRKYKHLNWRDARFVQEGHVTNALGEEVGLKMDDDARQLRVTKIGNTSWVMNDFQNVCKNVCVSGKLTDLFSLTTLCHTLLHNYVKRQALVIQQNNIYIHATLYYIDSMIGTYWLIVAVVPAE